MAYAGTNIGVTVAISVAMPSTTNAAGFGALSYTPITGVTMWPGMGDNTADTTVTPLDGRTIHLVGAVDGGKGGFAVRSDEVDAGQILLRSVNNLTTNCSIRVTDSDGKIEYSFGLVQNIQPNDRDATTWKGFKGEYRANSSLIRV